MYRGETALQRKIRKAYRKDKMAKSVMRDLRMEVKSQFHLQNGILRYKQKRLYVPKGGIRYSLLRECHDGPLAGHGGAKRTATLLKKEYFWPKLREEVEEYVKTCTTCQQNRSEYKNKRGCYNPCRFQRGLEKLSRWIS